MVPSLVGKEKTHAAEFLPIPDGIVKVHLNAGEIVMDFFAGSGTTGVAAATNNRV